MLNIPSAIVDLLKSDSVHKNFRVHFPNGEHADLTNSDIVQESVTLNESICSGSQLKLGVCETPSLEFETIGVGKIKGCLIECYMEVECPSTVTDAVYRSDIDMWVYPIPYGVFVVDSCKKQADMTHRKIVAYNKAGYTQWQFNEITQNVMSNPFCWYNKGLKISLEAIMKLLFPDINTDYQLTSTYGFLDSQRLLMARWYVPEEYRDYECVIVMDYYRYTLSNNFANIYDYKIELSDSYCAEAQSILDTFYEIAEEHSALTNDEFSETLLTGSLGYNHYSNGNLDYTLSGGVSSGGILGSVVKYSILDDLFSPLVRKIFCNVVKYTEGVYTSESYWQMGNVEHPIAPVRLRLLLGNPSQSLSTYETIAETDMYTPNVYLDVNAYDNIDLFNSPSGTYVSLNCQKKTITMTKHIISSGTYTDVQQDVYVYDFSTLLNVDSQKIIEAYCELNGKFGLIKRNGQIEFVSVNDAFTTPDENIPKSQYSSLWYDDDMSLPYGRIAVNYTNTSNEKVYTYYDIYDDYSPDKYKLYDLSNNFFIQQNTYTEQQIQAILQNMASNIDHISYMPIDLEMKGRPDLQAGDVIIIESDEEDITGFIMQRTISGIQGLIDNIKAQDDVDNDSGVKLNGSYDEESGVLTLYTS